MSSRKRVKKDSLSEADVEYKFLDTTVSGALDAVGAVAPTGGNSLVLVAQGASESNRVGLKITVRSIDLRGFIYSRGVYTGAYPLFDVVVLYLVLDKQPNGAAPSVTDVFNGSLLTVCHVNKSNEDRFVILKKYVHPIVAYVIDSAGGGLVGCSAACFDIHEDVEIPVYYTSTAASITNVKSNNICVFVGCSNHGMGQTANTLNISAEARVCYTDC